MFNEFSTIFDVVSKSDWNKKRLRKQKLQELSFTPYLYPSQELFSLNKQCEEPEECMEIIDYLYRINDQLEDDIFEIESYAKLQNTIFKKKKELENKKEDNAWS
jgi:squalene cyclase